MQDGLNDRAAPGDIRGMEIVRRSCVFVALGVVVLTGRANGAEPSLLVAVEVAPTVDIRPGEVRETVASELGTAVVGASDPRPADEVLLVALEPREIRMSLYARSAPTVTRAIDAPADRSGRLRSIAWLAGNLVRDQVGPIVAAAREPRATTGAPAPTEPPPLPAAEATDVAAPPTIVSPARSRPPSSPHSPWAVTAAGGLVVSIQELLVRGADLGTMFKVEGRHQTLPESSFYGVALEVGADVRAEHELGGAAFVGSDWRHRWFFLEGDLGLGVELLREMKTDVLVTNSSTSGVVAQTTTTMEHVPGLYARLQGTAGVRVTAAFDVVAQLGLHLSSTGGYGSFVGSTVGLRLRLP